MECCWRAGGHRLTFDGTARPAKMLNRLFLRGVSGSRGPINVRRHPMARLQTTTLLFSSCVFGLSLAAPAAADDDRRIRAKLSGFNEDPLTLSTPASGNFRGKIDRRMKEIEFELSYEGIETAVLQAHIHFGGQHQSGGVSAYLCTNLR